MEVSIRYFFDIGGSHRKGGGNIVGIRRMEDTRLVREGILGKGEEEGNWEAWKEGKVWPRCIV